jgi:hypothetical protein
MRERIDVELSVDKKVQVSKIRITLILSTFIRYINLTLIKGL